MHSNALKILLTCSTLALVAACGKHEASAPAATDTAAAPPSATSVAEPAAPSEAGAYTIPGDAVPGGVCSLDAVNGAAPNGQATATSTGDTVFSGWLGDSKKQVPATASLVLKGASGSYSLAMVAGGQRPDVATAIGEGLGSSGYNLTGKLAGVAPGSYELQIALPESPPTYCPLNVVLTVTQ